MPDPHTRRSFVPPRVVRGLFVTAAAAASLAAAAQQPAPDGKTLFDTQCALCHGPGGDGGSAPVLHGVAGRRAASTDFPYSAALKRTGWSWDDAHLDRYLADPQAAVPGTAMPVGVADAGERRALIAYLKTLHGAPAAAADANAVGKATPATTAKCGDWRSDAPGRRYRIDAADLPPPYATESTSNGSQVVARPSGALPHVPPGFEVSVFADGLDGPRQLRVAPNGDVFVSETDAGRVVVLRPSGDGRRAASRTVFATGLAEPFGLAFQPAGSDPQWLYVAETNRVVRFRYRPGVDRADAAPEVVLARLASTSGGHSNRDLAISNDGRRLYVGVGSASNIADGMSRKSVADAQAFDRTRGVGAAWDAEDGRALVLTAGIDGSEPHAYATGIRNCSGIAVQPTTGTVWCSTNERDRLGDDLVPDYVTRVVEGGFYGWPWYYIGDHEDPRLKGQRPDLAGHVAMPDVLLQPHSASLGIAFADGAKLPAAWRGSAFAAEHGSWNRATRTGPKLIRIVVDADGKPTGGYEDVMTGFVVDNRRVWGRPVGVTVAHDGSLLIADDAGGVVWRLAYTGR